MTKVVASGLLAAALLDCGWAMREAEEESALLHNAESGPSLDWSSMVTEAPDQGGHCNSCYLWATVGSIESRWAIWKGLDALRALSVQQALDCMWAEHMEEVKLAGAEWINSMKYRGSFGGCGKGEPAPVNQYAIDEGFMFAEDYPLQYDRSASGAKRRNDEYVGKRDKQCMVHGLEDKITVHPTRAEAVARSINTDNIAFKKSGKTFERIAIEALASGPIAVGISDSSFTTLSSQPIVTSGGVAVMDCPNKLQSHAVLLVGYGETEDGKKYWKLRNSWGKAFDNGFFKIPRGVNFCGAEQIAGWLEFKTPA